MLAKILILGLASKAFSAVMGLAKTDVCGTAEPTERLAEVHKSLAAKERVGMQQRNLAPQGEQSILVDLYIHVVANSTFSRDYLERPTLEKQVKVLNNAYKPSAISFNLRDADWTVNSTWAMGNDSNVMRNSLHKGDKTTLNLYFLESLDGVHPKERLGPLGTCSFPSRLDQKDWRAYDGCLIHAGTVPGGSLHRENYGLIAVHEVGHWFGLFHTFQNGCEGDGDMVDDTPAHKMLRLGCDKEFDSCPDIPGLDPIHNYMNYPGDERCFGEFTKGQTQRMRSLWDYYRAPKPSPSAPSVGAAAAATER